MGICLYLAMSDSARKRGRPKHCRRIQNPLNASHFAPDCRQRNEWVEMTLDELEALRLTDLEDMYQVDAARLMNVSRQTLGRILKSAHKKVADSLINGKALNIHGGNVRHRQSSISNGETPRFCICPKCETKETHKPGLPCQSARCPSCGSKMLKEGSENHSLWLNRRKQK